jgi:hypothetical protein
MVPEGTRERVRIMMANLAAAELEQAGATPPLSAPGSSAPPPVVK